MANFVPHINAPGEVKVPFFEDNAEAKIPGWRTRKEAGDIQGEITRALRQLGATNIYFEEGVFPGNPKRYGYRIHFQYLGALARYDCAALPLHTETKLKKQRALAQALFLIRQKFDAMAWAHVYEPDSLPLVPYLIGTNGQTVTEALRASGSLPMLGSGKGK